MDPIPAPETKDTFIVSPFGKPWEHWLVLGFALGSIALLVVLGVLIDPDPRGFGTHERLGLPSCKPMDWWNIPCPGCGVTTSMALAAHGSFWAAIRNQPFGFVVVIGLPVFAAWAVVSALRGKNLAQEVSRWRLGRLGIALIVIMVASWIYKFALVRHWIG
ncbi:MAG: DUF2752 domain-containing protein [Planctomycetes bacterium]|nr:DUF2752 domain-containing protein [Planctomycetota bacterium]